MSSEQNPIVAITGGIGAGKSYVCKQLAHRGIKVYDCDMAAKRLMRDDEEVRRALVGLVGTEVYVGKVLQKRVMAQFLLQSETNKQAVNDIVHPAVARDFEQSDATWLESAILFDSGFNRRTHFDCIVCVSAPEDIRIKRVMERDDISREEALQWIGRQLPQEQVEALSDIVVINDGHSDINTEIDKLFDYINNNSINKINKTKQMETILSIAGRPGLYRLVSRGKANLIVEALDETKKRTPAFASDRITSLGDIAMFTDAEDIPLWQVLKSVGEKEESKESKLNYKKASSAELRDYFAEVLPNYDRDRVHDSDIRKLLQWYNILVKSGITDFETTLAPTEGDNIDDRQ